jgi:16S rRNA (uracil1498-N3)-methyltransferase
MQLFYAPDIKEDESQFLFDKNESRHIVKALRKKSGDIINITDGRGKHSKTLILEANEKKCSVKITQVEIVTKPWEYYLHIAIAPTKLNERTEWFLEKATEIGIDEITLILCDHAERKTVKIERFEKIIHSAAKQSLKFTFPKINTLISFDKFIETPNTNDVKLIAHCDTGNQKPLKTLLTPSRSATILIGPEGDFSPREIKRAKEYSFQEISLGKSRLRTETAAIVACNIVSIINE